MVALVVPRLVGGLAGALMLRATPSHLFDRLVPFLILFAAVLFMLQGPIQRRLNSNYVAAHNSAGWRIGGMLFQLLVGIYGGYFGAGIARKLGSATVRRIVIGMGFAMALSLCIKR